MGYLGTALILTIPEKNKLFHVITKIRFPEIMIAIAAGACLGLAGALMQIILNNPLASPFTLGISAASAFGAALAICLELYYGIAWLNPSIFAFIFSITSIVLLMLIITFSGVSQRNIILVGLAVNFFFNAANTFLQYYATPDAVYQITFWTTGSLTTAVLKHSAILFSVLTISLIVSLLFSKDLGIIQQGERNAVMHGVNVSFSAMDIKYQKEFFSIANDVRQNLNAAILITIHDINLAVNYCDRLIILNHGNIIYDGNALSVASDVISEAFDTIVSSKCNNKKYFYY